MLANAWTKLHAPRAYLTVEPVLFVFMFASFLSYSTFQQLVYDLVCQQTPDCLPRNSDSYNSSRNANETSCNEPSPVEQLVQSETSHWILYVNLATGVPAIVLSIVYGSLCDQIGRKFFLVLPAIGSIINAVVVLEVVYMQNSLPIAFFLLGAIVYGFYGSFTVLNVAAFSYASDISAQSKRTSQIGVLESMTYLGATLSQIVGGLWIKYTGSYAQPFLCIVCCNIVVIAYTIVFLPESQLFTRIPSQSVTLQNRPRHTYRTCYSLFWTLQRNIVGFGRLLLSSWEMVMLLIIFFVVEINFLGITDIVILFALGSPLCWSSDILGYFLALKVFLNGMAALVLLPLLVYCKVSDTAILIMGLLSGAAGLVIMGLSSTAWMMFIAPLIAAMRGCVVPVIRSMLSKLVPADKHGVLFSGVGLVEATCDLTASAMYNALYPATHSVTPGFCFFIMAVALALPFILAASLHIIHTQQRNDERRHLLQQSDSSVLSRSTSSAASGLH